MRRLITTTDAAKFLGVSKAFLERDRWAGARIPFVRVGSRGIRYEVSALETYIQQRTELTTNVKNSTPSVPLVSQSDLELCCDS